jgi:uncharacterized oxidoreductase
LTKFLQALLLKAGFNHDESISIADSLTLTELTGYSSHGLLRVRQYISVLKDGHLKSGADLKIVQETPTSITVDAQAGVGQLAMRKLLDTAYTKLESNAVVTAAVRNCGDIGRLGEWVERPAREGFIALMMVNDNGTGLYVAPPGGKRAVTSTNPIAWAIPMPDEKVFSTDMSTSAIAFGRVKLARLTGTQVPPHCIQDADGNPTKDPAALFTDPPGSILPMGGEQGYKGFALAMLVEMLVAGLSGGQATPATAGAKYSETSVLNNIVLTLWNPQFFSGAEHLLTESAKFVNFIKSSSAIDPSRVIRLPGDRMNRVKQDGENNGIRVDDNLADDLDLLARELGLRHQSFDVTH